MAESWTAGWKGEEEEREASKKKTAFIAPFIGLVYGIGFAFFAFDQVMSMEQAWFSNLFGNFVCWGGILSAVAACAVSGLLSKDMPGFEGEITTDPSKPDGTPRKLMDISRLRDSGWSPRVALEDGLALAYDDFRAAQGAGEVRSS